MNKDKISAFTLRIASSNGSGLISILYDIYEEYEQEAIAFYDDNNIEEATSAVKKCSEVVTHLKNDLNFDFSISKELYSLYDFVQRALSRSIYKGDKEGVLEAKTVMDKLGEAFAEIADNDTSAPIMRNTQSVVAGYTYGRNSLNENLTGNEYNRGFWA